MTKSYPQQRYPRLPAPQSIRIFEAAARHLSFTRAADELAITQSGVSKQIKGLESFLEVSLFVREGHQIYLTEAGRLFYNRCTQALDCLQQGVNELKGESGRLHLQVPPTMAARWLIPRMEQLHRSHPQLDLHIETTWLRKISDHIQTDGNELVIHACQQYPYDDLQIEPLRRESLCVLVAPSYLEQQGPIDCPQDLVGKALIHTRLDGHFHWEAWAQTMGLTELDTSHGYEFETLDMALSAAENGIGVVVCDLLYALDSLESGKVVIPFPMPIMTGLNYLLMRQPNPRYQSLQDSYRNWLREQLADDERRMRALLTHLGFAAEPEVDAFAGAAQVTAAALG